MPLIKIKNISAIVGSRLINLITGEKRANIDIIVGNIKDTHRVEVYSLVLGETELETLISAATKAQQVVFGGSKGKVDATYDSDRDGEVSEDVCEDCGQVHGSSVVDLSQLKSYRENEKSVSRMKEQVAHLEKIAPKAPEVVKLRALADLADKALALQKKQIQGAEPETLVKAIDLLLSQTQAVVK